MTYQTGDLSIICRAHRRRCFLEPPGEYGARIRHEGGTGELCLSNTFLVRREEEYTRVRVLGELVAKIMQE